MTRFTWCAAICAIFLASSKTHGAVIINEVAYDDTGAADDFEFVELYNTGPGAVDISGWSVGGRDNAAGVNPSAVVPAATSLAAGTYYVFGNTAVPTKNQTVAVNFLENDSEQLELWNGAFGTSTLMDGFVYEANRGPTAAGNTSYGVLSPAMAAEVGGGYWGNFQSGHVNGQGLQSGGTGSILVSQSRYIDGLDTNNNGRDFGLRRPTPGAANSSGVVTSYTGPNVDASGVGTEAPGLYASFVNPRVIDPTVVSTHNPSVIPASPQGGNAITSWDTEFGGSGGGVDGVMQGSGRYELFVYVDPRVTTAANDFEEWNVGIGGGSDPLHNTVNIANSVNGSTGLAWSFRRDNTTRTLQLIDFGAGGTNASRVLLGTINLSDADLGWHRLMIDINGTSVSGAYDTTVFNGSTVANLVGNITYFSYREGFASNTDPLLRPLTIDMIPEPSGLVLVGLCGLMLPVLRRRK